MNIRKCRDCGAEINWIRMKSGKSMPVETKVFDRPLENNETGITKAGECFRGPTPHAFTFQHPHWQNCTRKKR